MLSINTNLSSLIAQSSLQKSTNLLNRAVERMTTGYKINGAKDNAANFSITTNMNTRIGAYQVAEDNASMGLDMVTTASESLNDMQNLATRLRSLAVQAQNGTYGHQSLNAIKAEAKSLVKEIDRLYSTAKYNGVSLLNRTEYDIPEHLPQVGKSGFIDESVLSEYALNRDEEDLFIDNPVEYTWAEVNAMTSIDDFDLSKSKKYKITSAEDLAKMAEIINSGVTAQNAEFVLACDIDLANWSSKHGNWVPIGDNSSDSTLVFRGTFNGNGHTISNLKIDSSNKDYQGLFGRSTGTIKNIALINADVSGQGRVGALVGDASSGKVTNCHSSGLVNGAGAYVGGMLGYGGTTIYCNANVDVTNISSVQYTGGLIGFGSATNCFANGDVRGGSNYTGGLNGCLVATNCYATGNVYGGGRLGGLTGTGSSKNSYATGNVYGASAVGGLVGESWGGTGLIENCFSTGSVYGTGSVGGLVGWNESKIENCYSLSNVGGSGTLGGLIGWFNVKNEQYVKNCVSTGNISGTGAIGGLIGDITNGTGTISLENCQSYSVVDNTNSNFTGSLIGKIKITSDEITYGVVNITNCQDRAQDYSKIGGTTKLNSNLVLSYDLTSMLEGISDVAIKDTNIHLQVGVNENNSSRITFTPKIDFDVSEIGKNIGSEETLSQIDDFLSLLSKKQTELGAVTNRLESALEEISVQYDNLVSSRSTLRDADIAKVSSTHIQQQILQQASSTLLATANQSPSIALQLI